jgi:hypothetical protein
MRVLPLVLALSVAAPAVAAAAPRISEVHVHIGPQLEAKANEYGQRDLDELTRDLKSSLERALAAKGRMGADGGRLEVTITDAVPNRPTFAQMGRNPSLSMRSIAVGGASMQAEEIGRDGSRHASAYSWYENDIRNERGAATWTDAERAFDMFAHRLADGK